MTAPVITLADLADEPRWVAWRIEPRADNPKKVTKVPYGTADKKAKANDPRTWSKRAAAEACAKWISGGIGLELGEMRDGTALGGVDLDTCRATDGTIEPWASEVIERLASYTEVSPSGTGAKVFFRYSAADLPELRAAMGAQHGREFKRGGRRDHPPAIEIHLSNRYFAVTGQRLDGAPEALALIGKETLLWLIREAGPAFAGSAGVAKAKGNRADTSRSGDAFRKGLEMRRAGASFGEMCEALRNDPETADWLSEKGEASGGRELQRIWDKAESKTDTPGKKETQADTLIRLARACDLFHTSDGTGFADVPANSHRETWPIRSTGFRRWLARRFYEAMGGAPNDNAAQSALNVIEATAQFGGAEREVRVRTAEHDGRIYIDLADAEWQVIEIDAAGWRVIANPPVRFRRATGMMPLPIPQPGGSIADLRRFVNVASDEDFVLLAAFLLAALRPSGPYPVLVLTGEHGSAKSTLAKLLRALIDPNTAPLRSLPHEDRDLAIAANNGHVIAVDNVSSLPPWLSDALCRLATGGGFSTRRLYSDDEETLFAAMRPTILNGIEDFVTRADLADREIEMHLLPIPEECRKTEAELWAEFEAARPKILGVLCDALAHGLAALPNTRLSRLPRMADFAIWATACKDMLWSKGTFMAAYDRNRVDANETVIEADAVATAVRTLVSFGSEWSGTAMHLLPALADKAREAAKAKSWPTTPRALSGRLRRAAPNLRRVGIEIAFDRGGHARSRTITITATSPDKGGPQPSTPSAETEKPKRSNGLDADWTQMQNGGSNQKPSARPSAATH